MSKEKSKSKAFEFNKKSIIALIVVSLVGILTGVFVGGYFIGAPSVDYSQYNEAELRDDTAKLSANAGTNSPSKYLAYQIFEIAEYRILQHGSFYVDGTGKVATIASQEIVSIKAYEDIDGGRFYKENLSVGIKKVGERTLYTKGGEVTLWAASKVNEKTLTATYKEPKTKTYEEIVATNGVPTDAFVGYIVSSKTVLNPNDKATKITLENGTTAYQFELKLNPVASVLNYVKQMKNLSKLSSYPAFSDITLTVVVDEDYRFISIDTLEHYTVNYMGVNAGCTGTLYEKFEYRENTIPDLS